MQIREGSVPLDPKDDSAARATMFHIRKPMLFDKYFTIHSTCHSRHPYFHTAYLFYSNINLVVRWKHDSLTICVPGALSRDKTCSRSSFYLLASPKTRVLTKQECRITYRSAYFKLVSGFIVQCQSSVIRKHGNEQMHTVTFEEQLRV